MKNLFELGNKFAAQSTWEDFAMTKLCLCSMGIIIGVNMPEKYKTKAMLASIGLFSATYSTLMKKVFAVAKEM